MDGTKNQIGNSEYGISKSDVTLVLESWQQLSMEWHSDTQGQEPVVHWVTRGPAGFVRVHTTGYLTVVLHTNFAPTNIRASPHLALGHLLVLRGVHNGLTKPSRHKK